MVSRLRDGNGKGLLATVERAAVRHVQSRPNRQSRLSTKPVVCHGAMLKRAFIVGRVWTAALLEMGCRCHLAVGFAAMSGSNQIDSDSLRLSAFLYAGEFRVLQVGVSSMLTYHSYHFEFTKVSVTKQKSTLASQCRSGADRARTA